jgi:hypothetical protein
MITVRFDDRVSAKPVALTVAALRADLFRIVVDSPADSSPIRNIAPAEALADGLPGGADEESWPADERPAVSQ